MTQFSRRLLLQVGGLGALQALAGRVYLEATRLYQPTPA
jgi:hypothetical protein